MGLESGPVKMLNDSVQVAFGHRLAPGTNAHTILRHIYWRRMAKPIQLLQRLPRKPGNPLQAASPPSNLTPESLKTKCSPHCVMPPCGGERCGHVSYCCLLDGNRCDGRRRTGG